VPIGRFVALIEPDWILLFSKKPGRWWVRLLACGRYHHVKAIAWLPAMQAWLLYDVKFNGTRLMLAAEDDPGTLAFLHDYLECCDLVAMPRLPAPRRVAPHAGFWCTLAMKHLVGIRGAALRPDRLWRDSIAAGGEPCENEGPQPFEAMLAFLKAHARASVIARRQSAWLDETMLGRRRRELVARLWARMRILRDRAAAPRGRPCSVT
jgi:hypothetical protein